MIAMLTSALLLAAQAGTPSASAPAEGVVTAARFEAAAQYSQQESGIGLLVRQGGELAFERYAEGFGADQAFPLYSAGHGFWAVAAVAADQDGLFDLDGSVAEGLSAWRGIIAKEEVLVHQLLDMSCGLDPNPKSVRTPATTDRYAAAVNCRMVERAGARFRFSPSAWTVFGALLSEVARERDGDSYGYLKRRVLDPLGIANREWERDRAGNPAIPFGAYLTAREWSLLGQLFLDGGKLGEEQLIASEALARCYAPSAANPDYGMGFWLRGSLARVQEDEVAVPPEAGEQAAEQALFEGLPEDIFFSAGLGGQRLYVIPSLDLAVVRMGLPAGPWSDVHFLRLLLGVEPQD